MPTEHDAGELLIFLYDCSVNMQGKVTPDLLLQEIDWGAQRILAALKHLNHMRAVGILYINGTVAGLPNFFFEGLTPLGKSLIEHPQEFRSAFGFDMPANLI